jgi:putative Holliday junction resolvase
MIATPHSVLERRPGRRGIDEVIGKIAHLVDVLNITEIVLGLPLRTDGRTGERESEVHEFARLLGERIPARVVLIDERFTTSEATASLLHDNVTRARRKKLVDKVAAALILQQYLDRRRHQHK